jgi:uncharacterized membrane protein
VPPPPDAASAARRFDRLDALRGVAMVWMTAFHFAFDLDHFDVVDLDFRNDPFWTVQRTCIVTLFLLCAGAGQAIADAQGQPWSRFWKRWAQVAGCAALVTIGSWWMFPATFISFGVLHGIAVMLIVVRLTASWGSALWPLGLLAIALPHVVQHPFFDSRWTNWIGLVTRLPPTEDYVPLLPWLGVMWWGAAAAGTLLRRRRRWVDGPLPRILRPLAVLGRWSLSYYMLHQPILIGLVGATVFLARRAG